MLALALALLAASASAQLTSSPPPPLAQWSLVDSGEVIALDIDFYAYKKNGPAYSLGFQRVAGGLLNTTVVVVSVAPSSAGTVLVYFDVLLSQTTDYAPAASFIGVQSLFCPDSAAPVDVGTPACSPLLTALQSVIPVAGAYYNDQVVDSRWGGTFGESPAEAVTRNEITLAVPFKEYAAKEEFYGAAFAAALWGALGTPGSPGILVADFLPSASGATRVLFDVVGATVDALDIDNLFPPCGTADCPAGPALNDALAAQGIQANASRGA